ncbi:MAG: tRNA (guanosine(37)-N1)-methyltransferase TrmD [Candidatus Levybacteria bacterium]|nr:tRNA (guanosine(37)-N1)-methyltransferase TrmD [Candidatus Levybacteria bacterium]
MTISILTLFPQMFQGPFAHSIIKKSVEKGLVTIRIINIRDFGIGRHKIVDDAPYGGGSGMIMRVDVVHRAIDFAKNSLPSKLPLIILLNPDGKPFTQKKAISLAKLEHLILICGHYEGIDSRIDHFIDEKLSIGDYVLTGGEIPAIVVTDTVVRLIKDVLKQGVTHSESFSGASGYLEYPQFTRPRIYQKLSVPQTLLAGDHNKIRTWREKQSVKKTRLTRPDLIKKSLGALYKSPPR